MKILKIAAFLSLLGTLPCEAQTTRSGMLGYNNSTFTNCGTNCITGTELNIWNSTIVNSAGFLQDSNNWTGRNVFNNTLQGAINLAPTAPPSTPANGDLWATGTGIFAQIGGVSYNLLGGGGGGGGGLSAPSMTVRGGVFAQPGYMDATGLGSAANKNIGISSGFVPTLGSLLTSGNCVAINSSGQLVDAGAPCASTGGGTVPVSSVSGLGAGVATALAVGANAGGGVGLVNSTAPTVGHCLQWGVGGITDAGGTCTTGGGGGSLTTVPLGGTGQSTFTPNLPLIGNGAGAIAQGTRSGNTTIFGTVSGALISSHGIIADAFGNLVDSGSVYSLNVDAYGAVGDGVTDDKVAFQNAAAALGASGGVIQLSCAKRYHLSTLAVPASVTFRQCLQRPDNPVNANSTSGYSSMGAVLLSSSGTISLGANAGLMNMAIFEYGLSFPASSASGFAGTAITFAGDGPYLYNLFVVGFNTLVAESASAVNRFTIEGVYGDGVNGILLTAPSYDSSVVRDVHLWPFATQPLVTPAALMRTGIGFELIGSQDDTRLDNILAYGYSTDFLFNATGSVSVGKIWADGLAGYNTGAVSITTGTNALTGSGTSWAGSNLTAGSLIELAGGLFTIQTINSNTSITLTSNYTGTTLSNATYSTSYANTTGVSFTGSTTGVKIDQLWSWSVTNGVVVGIGSNNTVTISQLHIIGTVIDGLTLQTGDLVLPNIDIQSTGGYAINVQSNASHIYARGVTHGINQQLYNGVVTAPSGAISNNLDIAIISDASYGISLFGANVIGYLQIPSAPTVSIPAYGDKFNITGTANCNVIAGFWGGRQILLNFSGAMTWYNTGNINLTSSPFTTAAGGYLLLVYDSATSKWVELARR